jgi:hypothetical protein
MNTLLNFDPQGRPSFQVEHFDLRVHCQHAAWETLRSISRHRRRVPTFVAVGLVLAAMVIPLMPRKCSAEALVYPKLFRSDATVRAVVKRLNLDRDPSATSSTVWSADGIKAWLLPAMRNSSPFDRAVAMLRNKVGVVNDTRSHLISVSYTASSADEAARVVNSFAIEYLRDKPIQHRLDRVNAAEGELGCQLAIHGGKHPDVVQARRTAARTTS